MKIVTLCSGERECKPIRASGNTTHNKPMYYCDNCKCVRYNPCTCIKKDKKGGK